MEWFDILCLVVGSLADIDAEQELSPSVNRAQRHVDVHNNRNTCSRQPFPKIRYRTHTEISFDIHVIRSSDFNPLRLRIRECPGNLKIMIVGGARSIYGAASVVYVNHVDR